MSECACVRRFASVCVRSCFRAGVSEYACMCLCVCPCVCACVCVFTNVCVCVFTNVCVCLRLCARSCVCVSCESACVFVRTCVRVISRASRIFPRMRMRLRMWAEGGKEKYVWADQPGFCHRVV